MEEEGSISFFSVLVMRTSKQFCDEGAKVIYMLLKTCSAREILKNLALY